MKKRGIWLLAAVLFAAIAIAGVLMFDKVTVNAPALALTEQGWRANFSSAVQGNAIEKGDIYLTDAEGNRVEASMELRPNGKTIEISQLPAGQYELHIKESAIKGSFFKSLDRKELTFSVQEEIQTLTDAEELRAYFAQVLALQQSNEEDGIFTDKSGATEESADSGSGEASGEGGNGGDYSTTNKQVEGVDEADLVKTDGSFIYSISENRVIITDVRNPDELAVADELVFEEELYPQQLFLNDGVLVVIGSKYSIMPMDGMEREYFPHMGMTTVHLYDIDNPASPELLREFGTEGNLNGARLAGNVLYYVTNVYPDFWIMEQQNDAELRPHTYDSKNGGTLTPMPYDSLSILPGTMEGSYSVISTIDLAEPSQNDISTKGFLGGSEQMYMSKDHLYLTAAAYIPAESEDGTVTDSNADIAIWMPQTANTEIFKFALEGTDVQFIASSEVAGSLLNQFSMDEHNGYFRIATTEGFAWNVNEPSKNHLFILDAGMKQVGAVEDLAKGERIYSARFIGDKAYMVTFKETDPLFVIDVSAPSAPKVMGELKIPGFSNYLHPLDENHLIGFGADTKLEPVKGGEPRVVTGGMKISLFDISDFSNPQEKDNEIIGGPGTYSQLQYDHKALFIHPEKNLYGFPLTMYSETDGKYVEFEGEGAMIYTITPDGITEAANLISPSDMQYEDWAKSVQRILYSGDNLYTVANSEVKSYKLETFELKDTLAY
ncbi:putative secreted protein with C-terminal beta-propeller domain [Planomicrobium koreense]|uniref:Putative secreted protein with C-terminal beta-propeller domain n=1 Tax=Planococcus koreensis TaxID=112331 RepID=A0A7W8CSJ1_9BACL|nr:beta-propeller domain-containing protein [Planococcus koreensis]MBB5179569.1 putative secreted protein with C-terminal beta-propeller domain [Planococcus koreensis]